LYARTLLRPHHHHRLWAHRSGPPDRRTAFPRGSRLHPRLRRLGPLHPARTVDGPRPADPSPGRSVRGRGSYRKEGRMKVQAILEFELEDWAAVPVVGRETLDLAAEDTDHAIRSRLIGEGFLDADTLVRTGTLRISIRDGPSEPDPPD